MPQPAAKRLVTEGGAQTITGLKTFTTSPVTPPLGLAALPAGAVVATSGTARPTTRADITVLWLGADPGPEKLAGDLWVGSLNGGVPTSPVSTYDSTVMADGPSFYLATATDDMAGGRPVARSGTITTAPLPNGALANRFNGTPQSYLSVASTPDVQCAPLGALTVEAWIIRNSDNGGTWENDGTGDGLKSNILGVGVYGPNAVQWHWRTIRRLLADNTTVAPRAHRWSAYAFNPAGGLGAGSYYQNAAALPNGQAFHMVAVYDDTQATRDTNGGWGRVTLYINGTQRDQDTFGDYSVRPQLVAAPLRIGSADPLHGFDGTIGKVAVYKKALSAARIAAHYTAMTGQQPPA